MHRASSHRPTAGFSIVELMVAMVIALVATIVIFQTFAVSEGVKRTSTSGGDAQQNGAIALYAMGRELRMAGYGINNPALIGCKLHAYDAWNKVSTDIKDSDDGSLPTLAPVVIRPAANNKQSDVFTVTYGNSDLLANNSKLTTAVDPTKFYQVSNRYGYSPGDAVLVVEGSDCSLAEVTSTPSTPGQTDQVLHDTGNYVTDDGVSVTARFNKAGGVGVSYTTSARIYNIGSRICPPCQVPAQKKYRITNNQLIVESMFPKTQTESPTAVIADNIVQMRVQYGKDTNNDGAVDTYDNTTPVNQAAWLQVLAVRLAVVARSALQEKPAVEGGACDTTTAAPTWSGGTLDVSADANWQCYRYRVFETTVPLRNLIWQQQPDA